MNNPLITEALEGRNDQQKVWDLFQVIAVSGNRKSKVWKEIQARAVPWVVKDVEAHLERMGWSL